MAENDPVRTRMKTYKEELNTLKTSTIECITAPLHLVKNYLMTTAGFDLMERQSQQSIDEFHSPKAHAKILKDNVAGIKTSYLNPHVKKACESIHTHLEVNLKRATTGVETLKRAIIPPNQAKTDALIALEESLESTRQFNEPLQLFKLRMETLEQLLRSNSVDNPRVITAYIKDQYDKMLEQLKLKKTADLELVSHRITALKQRPGPGDHFSDFELDDLEASLKKDINESYDKAEKGIDKDFKTGVPPEQKDGKDIDKGTPSLFKEFDKATRQAEAELHNFVLFAEKSKSKTLLESGLSAGLGTGIGDKGRTKYRENSFEKYAASIPERETGWLSPTAWFQYSQFLMNNRSELVTPSGLRLSVTDSGIQFSFPTSWSSYYHYQDRLLGADMMILVKRILALGKDEITLTLNCDDPMLRKKIMEEFYYAAHLAGFPDDKIKFSIAACPAAHNEEEKKPIDGKTANEIKSMLGSAPTRAQLKKQEWDQEQQVIDRNANQELHNDVEELESKINVIVGFDEPEMDVQARSFNR